MLFDFIGMQALYLSLARADAGPLARALTERPSVSPDSQWATFVRNHDELTLDKLGEQERAEVFAAFGPEERMQVYGRGLRRRLPPMLSGDPRGSAWSTACCSPCPVPRCCSTARRSGWERSCRPRAATPSGRRCSGRRDPTAASPTPPRGD